MKKFFIELGVFIITLIVVTLSIGFIAHSFYGWFILPILPMLPHFTTLNFIGIILFLDLLFLKIPKNNKDSFKDRISMYITAMITPWMAFLFGYIVKCILF